MKTWLIVLIVLIVLIIIAVILALTVFKKKASTNLPDMASQKVGGKIDPQNAWIYTSQVQLFFSTPPQHVMLAQYSAVESKISEGDIQIYIGENNLLQVAYLHAGSTIDKMVSIGMIPANKIINVKITYDGNSNIAFFVDGKNLQASGTLDLSLSPVRGPIQFMQQPSVYAGTRNPTITATL